MLLKAAITSDDAVGDAALLAGVIARQPQAFRMLMDRYALRLRRIAYRMIGNVTEAEDVVQEAFTRLWDHAALWQQSQVVVGAWMHRVTVNLCLDRLRKRRFASDDPVPDGIDEAPLADAVIDAERQREKVVACIAALSDRQRAAIVLTYYEGLSNMAASGALDMNIKAFESLLLRARQALHQSLTRAGIGDLTEMRVA